MAIRIRKYAIAPEDRVLRSYFFNREYFSGLAGPVGGGKTLASLQRFVWFAKQQKPHPVDNVRRTRWVSLRLTYRELERTTLKTWNEWWPRDIGEWRGGANGEPATHKISFGLPDNTSVDMEIIFAAVGETDIVQFAGGFEVTGFHLGEAADHFDEVPKKMLERVGRYPRVDKSVGFEGATWSGGWCDFNMPDYGHWIERDLFTQPLPGWKAFRQPGGLDRDAENLANLPGGRKYYERMSKSMPDYQKRRFVDNQFGFSRTGKPVYPEYDPFRHRSNMTLDPVRGRRIVAGVDQGRKPACTWQDKQIIPFPQLRILRELAAQGVDGETFGRMCGDFAHEQFPGVHIDYVLDPAAWNITDTSKDDDDVWMNLFKLGLGDRGTIVKAPNFKRAARERNIRSAMKDSLGPDKPGLLIDPSCQMVHDGFLNNFRFKKTSAPGRPDRFSDEVDKDMAECHVCEAAEYGSMMLYDLGVTLGLRSQHGHVPPPEPAVEHWRVPGF